MLCLLVAMAVALGNLYHDDVEVNTDDLAGVLAAASALKVTTCLLSWLYSFCVVEINIPQY